jgi:ABC-type nitrate/sulfonate/bicarbonate transport system ATPase subunit
METPGTEILKIENISIGFDRLPVLEQISLSVRQGEFVCILGPSGCGKTTLLRTLAGLLPLESGRIYLNCREYSHSSSQTREVGIVFQEPRLLPWRNCTGNLQLPFELEKNEINAADNAVIRSTLALVGLTEFADAYPHQLSGGMRQRVSLARALVNNPRILLMDEPLTGLDVRTREELQEEIIRIWATRGMSLLWVTHDPEEAVYMADRIIVLTPRPAQIKAVLDIPLSRPRSRNNQSLADIEREVRTLLS